MRRRRRAKTTKKIRRRRQSRPTSLYGHISWAADISPLSRSIFCFIFRSDGYQAPSWAAWACGISSHDGQNLRPHSTPHTHSPLCGGNLSALFPPTFFFPSSSFVCVLFNHFKPARKWVPNHWKNTRPASNEDIAPLKDIHSARASVGGVGG